MSNAEVAAENAPPQVYDLVEKERDPRGRPTDYRAEFCEVAAKLAAVGATDCEIALELGCHPSTLYRWMIGHPEFREALKLGKEVADDRVERSLYHRANGYSYPTVKIMQDKGLPVVVKYIEHVPPDVAAATLWLTNRRPNEWKSTKTVELKHDKSDLATVDSIIERFRALKSAHVVEGTVVEPPRLTNGSNGNGAGR